MKINRKDICTRLLTSPVVFVYILYWHILSGFKMFLLWLKNGGEFYPYSESDKETIHGIYQILGKSHVTKSAKK